MFQSGRRRSSEVWLPTIPFGNRPRYLEVARAIEDAIQRGEVGAGARLPSQRDLARHLGVTVGTIGRAYAIVRERGLMNGEVGRGSFVRAEGPEAQGFNFSAHHDASAVDLTCFRSPVEDGERIVDGVLGRYATLASLQRYPPPSGFPAHRIAGARWIGRSGWVPPTGQVIVTAGAQQALVTVLGALTRRDEVVLTEELTYSGFKALARVFQLRLEGVAMDREGIIPEALERACAETRARIVYLQPTVHNPTGAAMPESRRRRIAEIVKSQGLALIEDDAACSGLAERPAPIASHAPDHACYITSLSKSVAPALRVGYLYCPPRTFDPILATHHTLALSAPPTMAEGATSLIISGHAEEVAHRQLEELKARHRLAAEMLEGLPLWAHPSAFHLWLRLDSPWRSDEFVASAAERGVRVVASHHFVAVRQATLQAVRVCLTPGSGGREELCRGLSLLAALLADPGVPQTAVI